jgi:hypothetical protein
MHPQGNPEQSPQRGEPPHGAALRTALAPLPDESQCKSTFGTCVYTVAGIQRGVLEEPGEVPRFLQMFIQT